MSGEQSGEVANALTQYLLAIHAHAGEWTVVVKLLLQCDGCCVIVGQVFSGPPISKTALVVIDVPEFVEAVADLVRDSGAGGTVVRGRVSFAIEKGRLQDSGGK